MQGGGRTVCEPLLTLAVALLRAAAALHAVLVAAVALGEHVANLVETFEARRLDIGLIGLAFRAHLALLVRGDDLC